MKSINNSLYTSFLAYVDICSFEKRGVLLRISSAAEFEEVLVLAVSRLRSCRLAAFTFVVLIVVSVFVF